MTDDPALEQIVARLARPDARGGHAIARAALLAEGPDFEALEAWILAHGGEPEALVANGRGAGGLHGARIDASTRPAGRPPVRYLLPAGALGA